MTDKEKIIDILLEFYEEYQGNMPNRPMIPSIYASKIIDSLQEEPKTDWLQELQEKLDSMSKEDFKKVFDKYAVNFNEEPINEDLEEAAHKYADGENPTCPCEECLIRTFKVGAKWKEKKDQEIIETAIHHAYHNGKLEMKEQMTAEAIDGVARPDDNEIWCNLSTSNLKDGDKCKVILIKEN